MSNLDFVIADVFTEKRFCGNQLAVFTNPGSIDAAMMQTIAREMNYSETTFLFPPERGGDYLVKIFTPAQELPFAGHPLVGSAYVIVSEGMRPATDSLTKVTLETGVGPIFVEVETKNGRAGRTTMSQPLPVVKNTFDDVARLAKALSLDASDIEQTRLPVEAIDNGVTVLIVPIKTLAAISRIKVDTGALERISNEMNASTVLTFTSETVEPASTVHCRVYAPAAGIIEDAATGSANGPLGFYMVRHGIVGSAPLTRIISEQGFEMMRPSKLHIEVSADPHTKEITSVRVGGGVVVAGRGQIILS
jgi:trans-2,3-dihydro-3-hydroxyanthranilate isomerase